MICHAKTGCCFIILEVRRCDYRKKNTVICIVRRRVSPVDARGSYNLNLSEAVDWGTGTESQKKCWACAVTGAYVMILEMDIATTVKSDLQDCGCLVHFFESIDFQQMSPHDELGFGGTQYVLARPGRSYIAYSSQL